MPKRKSMHSHIYPHHNEGLNITTTVFIQVWFWQATNGSYANKQKKPNQNLPTYLSIYLSILVLLAIKSCYYIEMYNNDPLQFLDEESKLCVPD